MPGDLLVGAYPSSPDDVENEELLTSILKLRVNTFVCLQLEYQTEGVTEEMWRAGRGLRPYFADAVEFAKILRAGGDKDRVTERPLKFVHFPIEVRCAPRTNGAQPPAHLTTVEVPKNRGRGSGARLTRCPHRQPTHR